MSAVITWTVTQMECYPEENGYTDVVFNVQWVCQGNQTANNTNYYSRTIGSCAVSLDPLVPYTPYADLTQEQVLGWIWSSGVDKAATEATIQLKIDNQINPPVVTPPLPWAA